jgi:hypothetical protein
MRKGITMLAAIVLLVPSAAMSEVVLNEIMADPASDWSTTDDNSDYNYRDDEWIEIFNGGSQPVDITGWRLRDFSSDSSWTYGFEGVILPGEAIVVYGNDAYAWEDSMGYSRVGLSLSNSGETIYLYKADLVTIADERTYEDNDAEDDRSTGRCPDGIGEWELFDGFNTGGGNGMLPTPGSPNCMTPAGKVPWGEVKEMLR